MGDRIVVMKDGIIQQFDTPQVLYNTPCNLFVAGFIGSPQMNFLDAVISSEGGKLYAVVGSDKIAILDDKAKALKNYVGKTVTMGIRPEDFQSNDLLTDGNSLTAKVEFCELLGAETNLYVYVNDIKVIVKMPSSEPHPTDDKIKVAVKLEKLHFFDPETQQAICH